MKLLFLNQHFGPDTPATGVLLHQLVHELKRRGHEPRVLTGADGVAGTSIIRDEVDNGIPVRRVAAIGIGGKSVLRRIAHYLSYFVLALAGGARMPKPDAIVCMSTPPILAPLLAWILSKRHGVPFYYNIQDLYPDVAIFAGRLPKFLHGPMLDLADRLEQSAAGVSVVGKTMAKHVAKRSSLHVRHTPNWADTDEIVPLPEEASFRKLWKLEDRFVVLYSGNLGVCHDTEMLLEAVDMLRGQPIDFLFVVSPENGELIRRRVGENPHVHLRAYQPRAALPALLATADVGLVSVQPGMSRFVLPCKTWGIMAAGKPVVAISDMHDDLYDVCKRAGAGRWVDSGNASALAQTLIRMQQDGERTKEMGRKARVFAKKHHSIQAGADAWEAWLGISAEKDETIHEAKAA